MHPPRGKPLALTLAALGVCVVVVGVVVFKDRIVEEWYLRKLRSGDVEEQKVAAERLAEMGSVRAVPVMLQKLRGRSFLFLPYEDMDGDGELDLYVRFRSSNGAVLPTASTWRTALAVAEKPDTLMEALGEITKTHGRACVSHLVNALAQGDSIIRHVAAVLLGEIGPEAKAAIPALTELLQDEDESIRRAAAKALRKIQRHEEPTR